MQTNLAMMRNLMDPLLRARRGAAPRQRAAGHQGLRRARASADGSGPRGRAARPHENFYWLQEDYIRAAAAGAAWNFTIWRPQVVFGGATGVAMNLIPILGAYGAICRELGRPFICPGEHGHVIEAVDADLIARALAWAAEAPAAADETFNITNGDVFVWENVWPTIAAALGLEPAFGAPVRLSEFLPAHAEVWDRIVARHSLQAHPDGRPGRPVAPLRRLPVRLGPGGPLPPALVSTIKLRQAGFGDCIDTEAMFRSHLARLVERRVLPKP